MKRSTIPITVTNELYLLKKPQTHVMSHVSKKIGNNAEREQAASLLTVVKRKAVVCGCLLVCCGKLSLS